MKTFLASILALSCVTTTADAAPNVLDALQADQNVISCKAIPKARQSKFVRRMRSWHQCVSGSMENMAQKSDIYSQAIRSQVPDAPTLTAMAAYNSQIEKIYSEALEQNRLAQAEIDKFNKKRRYTYTRHRMENAPLCGFTNTNKSRRNKASCRSENAAGLSSKFRIEKKAIAADKVEVFALPSTVESLEAYLISVSTHSL